MKPPSRFSKKEKPFSYLKIFYLYFVASQARVVSCNSSESVGDNLMGLLKTFKSKERTNTIGVIVDITQNAFLSPQKKV